MVLLLSEWLCPASQNHWVPLISVGANGIFFLGTHFVRNNGFAVINAVQAQIYLWRPRRESILISLKQWLYTPKRIVSYS